MKRLLALVLLFSGVAFGQSYSGSNITPTASSVYVPFGGGGNASSIESFVSSLSPNANQISNLFVSVGRPQGTGTIIIVVLRDNSSSQSLTCSIQGSATSCNDTIHSFTPALGDFLDWQIITDVPFITNISISYTTSPIGFGGRTVTTNDIVLASDRGTWLLFNGVSPFIETLPQANSPGFTNNFSVTFENTGAGAVTISPTVGTIDGQSLISIQKGQHGVFTTIDNVNYISRISGNSHQISSVTNFGTALGAQTVVALVPAIGPLGELVDLKSVVVQSTSGAGCGAGTNTVSITWSFTAPGGAVTTIAGDTISISANGALDTLGAGSTVRVAAKSGTAITYTAASTLASANCTTVPQYTIYAKVVI